MGILIKEMFYTALLVLVILTAQVQTSQQKAFWRCKGSNSTVTDADCVTLGDKFKSCYYVESSYKFFACPPICNDVQDGSIKYNKCDTYCPGYLVNYCQPVTVSSTVPTVSTSSVTPSTLQSTLSTLQSTRSTVDITTSPNSSEYVGSSTTNGTVDHQSAESGQGYLSPEEITGIAVASILLLIIVLLLVDFCLHSRDRCIFYRQTVLDCQVGRFYRCLKGRLQRKPITDASTANGSTPLHTLSTVTPPELPNGTLPPNGAVGHSLSQDVEANRASSNGSVKPVECSDKTTTQGHSSS